MVSGLFCRFHYLTHPSAPPAHEEGKTSCIVESSIVNDVDLLILVLTGVIAAIGAGRGLWLSLLDIGALAMSLTIGSFAYPLLGIPLRTLLGLPQPAADALGFLGLTLGIVFAIGWLARYLPERSRIPRRLSQLGGGLIGMGLGLTLSAGVVMLSGALLGNTHPIESSFLGDRLLNGLAWSYGASERIGIAIPKLSIQPVRFEEEAEGSHSLQGGLRFRRINFARLDGATCIKCRGKMRFLGYSRKVTTLLSPKFQCTLCGRTTDGCQTFEGFHRMYGHCPVDEARQGRLLDCGVWTNNDPVAPNGPCPVCGQEYSVF